jgi:hypothetical protein
MVLFNHLSALYKNRSYKHQRKRNLKSVKKSLVKTILRKNNPIEDLLNIIGDLRVKSARLMQKLNQQKNRADKWSSRCEDLKNIVQDLKKIKYDKIMLDNEQLRKTNQELNLMHHQAVVKVLNLGQEIIKLKGKK